MNAETLNQESPPRPVLLFDGDCGFCRQWIARWRQLTRGNIEYLASQAPETSERFPDIPAEWFKEGVVLIEPGREPVRCAHAVFRTLALAPGSHGISLWFYQNVPGIALITEFAYGIIARHRGAADALTKLLWLRRTQLPRLALTRWIFLRGMAIIYFAAFLSLGVQIRQLVGTHGILPAQQFFDSVAEQLGGSRYLELPSVFWWTGASNAALRIASYLGAGLSVLLFLGVAQVPVLILLWGIYLSLCGAGQEFLEFQWDMLLLEAGLLSIFVAPLTLLPHKPLNEGEPPRLGIWMLRWFVARFMFQSGIVKILSGDPTWRDLTALTYHFETQPLPTVLGWFMHHAPLWFLKANTLAMYAIEIGLAFFVFGPRGLRIIAAVGFSLLQVVILLTGNYGFFNWLSIVICIPLLDDFVWPWKWGGKRLLEVTDQIEPEKREQEATEVTEVRKVRRPRTWGKWVLVPVAVIVFAVTGAEALLQVGFRSFVPAPLMSLVALAQPFRSLNSYGLFAVMTTERPEITIQGSQDGQRWETYLFKYKPGELNRAPVFCEPHMPRLDWQMWFAALGSARHSRWLLIFEQRLLEGNKTVTQLLRHDPFPGNAAPKYVRAMTANYHFTGSATRRETGNWWRSEQPQPYSPVLKLENGRLAVASELNEQQ